MKRTVPALLSALLVLVAIDLVVRTATRAEAQVYTPPRQLVGVSGPISMRWHANDGEIPSEVYITRAWSDGTVEAYGVDHVLWKGWKQLK